MKKLMIAVYLFGFIFSLKAQETYKLEPFDEVQVSSNIELTLIKANVEKIEITTSGVEEDDLNITTDQGILQLKIGNGIYRDDEKAVIKLSYKKLRAIRASAGAYVTAPEVISGDQLAVKSRSGAIVNLEVATNKLELTVLEGAELYLKGSTTAQKVKVNTGAIYDGRQLECDRTYARASTGAEAMVVANKYLEAKASLGGEVAYFGNPEQIERSTSWGGDIDNRGSR